MRLNDIDEGVWRRISAELAALADEIAYDPDPGTPADEHPDAHLQDAESGTVAMEVWREIERAQFLSLLAQVAPRADWDAFREAIVARPAATPERPARHPMRVGDYTVTETTATEPTGGVLLRITHDDLSWAEGHVVIMPRGGAKVLYRGGVLEASSPDVIEALALALDRAAEIMRERSS